jgi:hypothetical protein
MLHHRTSAGEYSYSVVPVLYFRPEGWCPNGTAALSSLLQSKHCNKTLKHTGLWYALSVYVQLLLMFPLIFITTIEIYSMSRPNWPSSSVQFGL